MSKSKAVKYQQPCPCGRSSDAAVHYDNGWGRCFSGKCGGTNFKWDADSLYPEPKENELRRPAPSLEEVKSFPIRGIADRRLIKAATEFYKVRYSIAEDGSVDRYWFPFSEVGSCETVGYKSKKPSDKKATYSVGKVGNMFGIEHFRNGGRKIVITEGEEDCVAVQSANLLKYKRTYPVVSMGGSTQTDYLLAERDTLRRFDEIVIWFDNDEEGQKALATAAKILGYEKIRVVRSDEKDANDALLANPELSKAVDRVVYYIADAKEYNPSGIVRGSETWERYKEQRDMEFVEWPPCLARLNELSYGRSIPSISMFAAGTGVGKSSLLREDIVHVKSIKKPEEKIGGVFLEETVGETTQGLISIALNKRIGLPGVETTEEEEYAAWKSIFLKEDGSDDLMFIDHAGSVSDSSLLDKIEYLAVAGCKYIYLDHITIAVSDSGDNVNQAIDQFMNRLLGLVQRHKVWIGVVSHLRKVKSGEQSFETGGVITEDDLKGSGSLKQVAYQTIALSRNKQHEDESKRHLTRVYLLKDRRTGATGPAGAYRFNGTTGRLKAVDPDEEKLIDHDSEIEIIGG